MIQFKINDYLNLKLENGKTNIYVNDKLFIQCKYLLLNVPVNRNETSKIINSIDEAAEVLDKTLELRDNQAAIISIEAQFWGHCSNLQAWYESDYDTRLLHSNLAFPLLKRLTDVGDKVAKKVFKDEIAKRFEEGHLNFVNFLIENHYLNYLNKEEIECLLDQGDFNLTANIINEVQLLWSGSLYKRYWKVANIIDILLFFALKYDNNYIFQIIEALPEKLKEDFVKKVILHLNYKEFKNYKIAYGAFFTFFEKFLEYIYNFLKLLDSGYLNGAVPLDEKFTVGTILSKSIHSFSPLY